MPRYTDLDRPAQFLKGVGPKRAALLARLGLLTARDLLYHLPHRYEDASTVQPIASLKPGMEATVVGRVVAQGVIPTRKGLRIFQAMVRDRSAVVIECSWPGQPFLERVIRRGDLLLISGSVRFYHGLQLQPKEYTILAREDEHAVEEEGVVFPVYPTTEGLPHRLLRTIIAENLDVLLSQAGEDEVLDREMLRRIGLPSLPRAFELVHRPTSLAEAELGRRRLAYDELFFLQLLHAKSRHYASIERPGIQFERKDALVRPFYRALPFRLTNAQKRVLREIGDDMAAPQRMTRLLQGDVGSGKTVVAFFALLRALENGYQAVLMAPTEILAEQHVRTLGQLLGGLPVEVHLLTSRVKGEPRRTVLERIRSGTAAIFVGTHALIQEGVDFARLGLVVIDEQHRFGVRQRLALARTEPDSAAGERAHPDLLVMSATPIPRSLALTLYGDLEISVLDERPPGRTAVRTAVRPARARESVYSFVREQVRLGRQAYVVYPLVEESDRIDLKAATDEFEHLRTGPLKELRIGLVHGQMRGEEKDVVMREFADGQLDVLVATTVIEVGIDVPNASVMVVEHAERFGLSQLHQLRGRIGRGAAESYCILIASGDTPRLRVLASTEDGFEIAREDMRLRGEGDLFGARQSGLAAFRFARLESDQDLLELGRKEARRIVETDPELARHPEIGEVLNTRFSERLRMLRSG